VGAFGGGNPFPFQFGGSKTPTEQAYDLLKQAVGVGNSAAQEDPDKSIIESWRFARARGLSSVMDVERAVSNAFPNIATDFIPVYEQILGLSFPVGTPDETKRKDLTTAYTRAIDATLPKLEADLKEIEPTVTLVVIDYDPLDPLAARDQTRDGQVGRYFEDWDPADPDASGPPFNLPRGAGLAKITSFPNFSDDFILKVEYPLPVGTLSAFNKRQITRMQDFLNDALPAWVGFTIFTKDAGFVLDQDLLDVTVFA
jgi:hypothetical protein